MSNNRLFLVPLGTMDETNYYTKDEVNALIADFITNTVDDLVNYYTKSETYTQTEVNNLIGAIRQFHYEIYPDLASVTDPQSNVLYLIGPDSSASGDVYEEYVYDGSDFVKIGDTSIDLSDYITTSDLSTALADYTPTSSLATVATTGSYSDLTGTPSLATVATTGAYSDLSGTPNLATVATSGDYTDLTNTPNLATVATTGNYSDLNGTPTLATVATSGDYDDLTNKPTIPAAQVNADWNASSGVEEILNKPTLATVATSGAYSDLSGTPNLATVATSGDYDDLTNKPTIPTVNDATVTITQGGVTKGSFTLNQSSNATIDVDAGGGSNNWYGTQVQFNALPNKDSNTNYWISDQIKYSEIKGTPDLSQYATQSAVNTAVTNLEGEIAGKAEIKYMTAQEYAAATKREGETYAVEGETVTLTFTLSDNSTVTHNFVVDD